MITSPTRGRDRASRLVRLAARAVADERGLNGTVVLTPEARDYVLQDLRARPGLPSQLYITALGEAPHGVVNAAVAAARAGGPKAAAAAGMVNAVLRRAAEVRPLLSCTMGPLGVGSAGGGAPRFGTTI